MRTIADDQQGVIENAAQGDFVRVSVLDTDGTTWRDLSVFPGYDAVAEVTWSEDVNDPGPTFKLTLLRESNLLSLSPYVLASPINLRFDPGASSDAFIRWNAMVKIECAIVGADLRAPRPGDWFEVFRGRIDAIDVASGYNISVDGRGLHGRLAQQFIKRERVYSLALVGGNTVSMVVWESGMAVAAGDYVLPATRGDGDPGEGIFFVAASDGVTGEFEPVWPSSGSVADSDVLWNFEGAISADGNPVEGIIQNLLTDNIGIGDSGITLATPSSPGWDIRDYLQSREYTLDAVLALAHQIGWDVRFLWDAGSSNWLFTFFQPTRDTPTVVHTFSASQYSGLTQMSVDISELRNHWFIWYPNSAALYPDGTPSRGKVEVKDDDSIAKYGDLIAEMQEDETSLIDTIDEATMLANSALSDCSEPTAQIATELMRGFPWVELNDFYTFAAGSGLIAALHFDMDVSLAVTHYEHTFANGHLKTSLQLRGKPTIGHKRHLRKIEHKDIQHRGNSKPHHTTAYTGPDTHSVNVSSTIGGSKVSVFVPSHPTYRNALPEEFEHHIYATSGTTLSGLTLYALTKSRQLAIADLVPGRTYYHTVVTRWRNGERLIRGAPSVERSFVAGQALAGHLDSDVDHTRRPLNGGFETQIDPIDVFDHWEMNTGTWGTEITTGGGDTVSGGSSISSDGAASAKDIISDFFSIERGHVYRLSGWIKRVGAATATIRLTWYDISRAAIGSGEVLIEDTISAHDWLPYCAAGYAPSNARFARVDIFQADPSVGDQWLVTAVDVKKLSLSGVLTWGNSSIPDPGSTGSYYMSPSSGGAADGTERVLTIPSNGTTGGVFGMFTVRFNGPAPHCGYTFTLRANGSDTPLQVAMAAGVIVNADAADVLAGVAEFELSVRADAVHTSGGSVPPTDVYVTLALYG